MKVREVLAHKGDQENRSGDAPAAAHALPDPAGQPGDVWKRLVAIGLRAPRLAWTSIGDPLNIGAPRRKHKYRFLALGVS